jgi:hypothetical protein
VSQLDGVFALRTPDDLLVKLESDYVQLHSADPTSIEAQYAAFNFFVTAEHLADWVSAESGESLSSLRRYRDGGLVSHVASGAKHFRVRDRRHKTVADTGFAGTFQADAFQADAFDVGRLVVALEDGSTVDVLDVAERVLEYWRKKVRP